MQMLELLWYKVGSESMMDMRLTKIIRRTALGGVLGLAAALSFHLVGLLVTETCERFGISNIGGLIWEVVHWPLLELDSLDQKRGWRIIHENPIHFFIALAIYWFLIGVIVVWIGNAVLSQSKKSS